jgi:hypothetical protein
MIALLALLLHGDSVSSSRIEVSGREAVVTFTLSMEDLAELARLDLDRNGTVEPAEWARVLPAVFTYLGERFRIDGCRSEGDLDLLPPAISLKDRRAPVTLRMRYVSALPLGRLRIRCELFREHEGNPRHVSEGPGGQVMVFDRERPEIDLSITPSQLPWGAGAIAALILGAAALRRAASAAAAA